MWQKLEDVLIPGDSFDLVLRPVSTLGTMEDEGVWARREIVRWLASELIRDWPEELAWKVKSDGHEREILVVMNTAPAKESENFERYCFTRVNDDLGTPEYGSVNAFLALLNAAPVVIAESVGGVPFTSKPEDLAVRWLQFNGFPARAARALKMRLTSGCLEVYPWLVEATIRQEWPKWVEAERPPTPPAARSYFDLLTENLSDDIRWKF